jgi:chorismate lyase
VPAQYQGNNMQWENDIKTLSLDGNLQKFKNWLVKPYIISQAMKKICKNLSVEVIDQKFHSAYPDENYKLNIKQNVDNLPLIRKVYLKGDDIPWSFGRVIIPNKTYLQYEKIFNSLGGKLIGESLLYNNPDTTRSTFEYCVLHPRHELFQDAIINLDINPPEKLWARRSVFTIKQLPLLVNDVFLPMIPEYLS